MNTTPTPEPPGRSFRVRCASCGAENETDRYECARCAGVLVVDADPVTDASPGPGRGIWRYSQLVPAVAERVTLGEGRTPVIDLPGRGVRVAAKLESLNPTLSFKDRGMALAASIARDRGCERLVVASTGNAAVSASAYAAAAGLECTVVVGSASNAQAKLAACRAYGSTVREVDGDYSTVYAVAREAESADAMNVTTTYRNPLLAEGYRSVAAELVEDLGEAPDAVIVPVGAGPFLRAIAAGFADLRDAGVIRTVPRMIGVQAEECAPLARAWRAGASGAPESAGCGGEAGTSGASEAARPPGATGVSGSAGVSGPDGVSGTAQDAGAGAGPAALGSGPHIPAAGAALVSGPVDAWRASLADGVPPGPTAATAIADALRGYEDQGLLTLSAAHTTGGSIVSVTEDEIAAAEAELRTRGIWAEPSSATALAAVPHAGLTEGETVALMITGHGIKSAV